MSHILAAATAIKFPVKDAAGQKSAALLNQAYAAIEETLQLMAATSEPQTQSYRGHAAVTGVQNFILDYYGKETRKQGSREIRLGLFASTRRPARSASWVTNGATNGSTRSWARPLCATIRPCKCATCWWSWVTRLKPPKRRAP
jgi:hypothetical protein